MDKETSYDDRHALPPPLMAAVEKFDAWSKKQLLVEQNAATPTVPLYHYTGEEALVGILRHEKLWCFSHLHQSDPKEFEYSLAGALDVIRQVGKSEDFWVRHFCGCLEDMLVTNGLASPFDFYLFSLSRHRDDAGQWRLYGKNGQGFAIGVAPLLLQPDTDVLSSQANENLHIGRVIYGDRETNARHRQVIRKAAAITSQVARRNRQWFDLVRPVPYLAAMAREVLASQLIWNCLTAKESKFANEREVRGIVMGVRDRFDLHRKMLGTRAYIEVPLLLRTPGGIAEIFVGPEAPADAEGKVRALLKAEGYTDSIPVIRSSAVI
ncbi:DUF2971 domain-containing protein [Bradyrhizobium sp. CCBAU 51627]|uniref:DUF2971 domain-containing protein n=1 Tax=Bradyrhizobium sp. CCBAU 51627 TaxID=1325088 RepID=UPI0023065CB1|nr:DUF2971 domain-containing protein [Bradyrhizobium sp. CCBAU 51627]MDA9433691.1 hypothetical protein [Bradyrhizobium sp. CCBAU 51627]